MGEGEMTNNIREIDGRVAEEVMGWKSVHFIDNGTLMGIRPYDHMQSVPYYTTDIAAAWLVVEKVNSLGHWFMLHNENGMWEAEFYHTNEIVPFHVHDATASTAPLAICRAALDAVGAARMSRGYLEQIIFERDLLQAEVDRLRAYQSLNQQSPD
jgi:hypothetical protein